MKKKEKLRGLTLKRETIRSLDEPKLLEAAQGGLGALCPTDSLTKTQPQDGGE